MSQSGSLVGVCLGAKVSGLVNVLIGAQTASAQIARDLTVGSGDVVVIAKIGSAYYVLQRIFTTASGNTDPDQFDEPPSAPTGTTGTTTFLPVRTVSRINGQWRTDKDDVDQGNFSGRGNQTGCAFYGTQLTSLSGATVLSATLNVKRLNGGASADGGGTLWGVTQSTKPSGAPTLSGGSFAGPNIHVGTTGKAPVDVGLVGSMVAGTYGGLAIFVSSGSPYERYAGLSNYSAAFALTVNWRR